MDLISHTDTLNINASLQFSSFFPEQFMQVNPSLCILNRTCLILHPKMLHTCTLIILLHNLFSVHQLNSSSMVKPLWKQNCWRNLCIIELKMISTSYSLWQIERLILYILTCASEMILQNKNRP